MPGFGAWAYSSAGTLSADGFRTLAFIEGDPSAPAGAVTRTIIQSDVLKGNPLGDSTERIIDVYINALRKKVDRDGPRRLHVMVVGEAE